MYLGAVEGSTGLISFALIVSRITREALTLSFSSNPNADRISAFEIADELTNARHANIYNSHIAVRVLLNEIIAGLNRLAPCLVDRITEYACRDQGKANRTTPVFLGELQRPPICAVEQLGFILMAAMPHCADRMDDVPGLQVESGCDDRRTRRAMTNPVTGFLQFRMPRRVKDRTANAATGPQAIIGCVDDCICVEIYNADFSN